MSESQPVRIVTLKNGLMLHFFDRTNRYFGDFHRVLVVVEGYLDSELGSLSDEQKKVLTELTASSPLYRRDLERMGVTSGRLELTVNELIDSFLDSAKNYLERPDIPGQLISKYVAGYRKRRTSMRVIR